MYKFKISFRPWSELIKKPNLHPIYPVLRRISSNATHVNTFYVKPIQHSRFHYENR